MMRKRSLAPSINVLLKIYNKSYPSLMLINANLKYATSQKHLLFILDSRFDFIEHIDHEIKK